MDTAPIQPSSGGEEDPYSLRRFVEAQATCFDAVRRELSAGHKTSHWMWFVFPQAQGLGRSAMAERYAIRSRAEALAYLRHPVLGPRLRECSEALLRHRGRSARSILGSPDDLKLRSSMTLFATVEGPGSVFQRVLEAFFAGESDEATGRFLGMDTNAK